jgi:hypothetical protein
MRELGREHCGFEAELGTTATGCADADACHHDHDRDIYLCAWIKKKVIAQ